MWPPGEMLHIDIRKLGRIGSKLLLVVAVECSRLPTTSGYERLQSLLSACVIEGRPLQADCPGSSLSRAQARGTGSGKAGEGELTLATVRDIANPQRIEVEGRLTGGAQQDGELAADLGQMDRTRGNGQDGRHPAQP